MWESQTSKIIAQDLLVMIYLNDVINTYQQVVDRLVPAGYMSDKSRARCGCVLCSRSVISIFNGKESLILIDIHIWNVKDDKPFRSQLG